jgi:membrane-associated phospholipid phosphatase
MIEDGKSIIKVMQKGLKKIVDKEAKPVPKETFLKRLPFLRIWLISLTIVFTSLSLYLKNNHSFFLDLPVTLAIQKFNPSWFDVLMRFITFLGDPIPGIITVIGITSILYFYFKDLRDAAMIIFSTVGGTLLSMLFKALIARPRPDPDLIVQIGQYLKADSFPSGHVLFAISFYGFLLFLVYSRLKKSILRSVLISFLSVLILLMGISRIYVGAHWFSDVLGAYLIGIVWLCIVVIIYKKLVD